ncbi:MAG: hypothetical protein KGY50_03785 [Candidatus Thermoplasmatota archaeon]|nr:hypothetical protein [Candidatus Thermoplasmatota archaeon]
MGFSISATSAIIGIAIIMVIEISVGTIIPVITDLDSSYDEMRQRAVNELQTNIEIQNITVQTNGSLHDLSIQIKNTGSTVIKSLYVDVLVDGSLSSFTCADEYWFPENTYTVSVNGLSGSGSKKVKIITNNGISEYHTYSV